MSVPKCRLVGMEEKATRAAVEAGRSAALAAKVARLERVETSAVDKAAEVVANVQKQTAGAASLIAAQERLAAKVAALKVDLPKFDIPAIAMPEMPDYASMSHEIAKIDWADMPEARAARAAEQTAGLLENLVEAALAAQAQAAKADARAVAAETRENKMLELTIANMRMSKVAAISGVIGVIVGLIAVVITVMLA
jgi:hypothetical protein